MPPNLLTISPEQRHLRWAQVDREPKPQKGWLALYNPKHSWELPAVWSQHTIHANVPLVQSPAPPRSHEHTRVSMSANHRLALVASSHTLWSTRNAGRTWCTTTLNNPVVDVFALDMGSVVVTTSEVWVQRADQPQQNLRPWYIGPAGTTWVGAHFTADHALLLDARRRLWTYTDDMWQRHNFPPLQDARWLRNVLVVLTQDRRVGWRHPERGMVRWFPAPVWAGARHVRGVFPFVELWDEACHVRLRRHGSRWVTVTRDEVSARRPPPLLCAGSDVHPVRVWLVGQNRWVAQDLVTRSWFVFWPTFGRWLPWCLVVTAGTFAPRWTPLAGSVGDWLPRPPTAAPGAHKVFSRATFLRHRPRARLGTSFET